MNIRQLRRTAIIVKRKEPYIQWANSLDEDGIKLGEDFEPEHTVYLIEDMTEYLIDSEAMIAPTLRVHLRTRIECLASL